MLKSYDPAASWRNYQRIRFIKGFYRIRNLVLELFDRYERSGDISHEHINSLLETHLRELRELSDTLYRMPDDDRVDRKKQRGFDKILSELWHELDKTRDNIRIIDAYFEDISPTDDRTYMELNRLDKQIVGQARRNLPLQLRHVRRIIDLLVPLFEQILPVYRSNKVLLRSLYFDRGELDACCKPNTVEYFFPLILETTAEGYMALFRSLLETKHLQQARSVLEEFLTWVKQNPQYESIYEQAITEFENS